MKIEILDRRTKGVRIIATIALVTIGTLLFAFMFGGTIDSTPTLFKDLGFPTWIYVIALLILGICIFFFLGIVSKGYFPKSKIDLTSEQLVIYRGKKVKFIMKKPFNIELRYAIKKDSPIPTKKCREMLIGSGRNIKRVIVLLSKDEEKYLESVLGAVFKFD